MRLGDEAQPEHARDLGVGGEARDLLADHRVVAQRLVVEGLGGDVLAQQVEPLLDGRVREHGEALEVERFGDVLEPVVELADHVVVVHEHVVEEHVVGALVTHGPDRVDGDAGIVEGHEEEGDAVVLGGLGIGSRADPVPLGEVGGRGPGLLSVEAPPVTVARRLELHRRGVGARVGLAVADREVDLVAEDLRQELLLHLLAAVAQDGLTDDADALADLGAAAAGERLVEEVLVDAVALLAAPFLRPGDAEPALLADLRHERTPLGDVGDLGHVLAGDVEHDRVVVGIQERLDLIAERELLGREIEVHRGPLRKSDDPSV